MKPFHGPKLKVRRAEYHISDLRTRIDTFLARDPYRIELAENPETGKPAWFVRITEDLSDDIPLVVGDAVHNLRSALDLLACDLVRLIPGKSDKGVAFPFANSEKKLKDEIKSRNIRRAGPDVVDRIERLKPYKGGCDALWAIHDLDITDKHKLILPTVFLGGIPNVATTFASGTTITFQDCFICPVYDGLKINFLAPFPDSNVGTKLPARFDVAFGEVEIFQSKAVVPTLRRLATLVHSIIAEFETDTIFLKCPHS